MRAAEGLRVLEIGEGVGAAYAALILAAQGADVCQVRSGLNRTLDAVESAYFDRGRSVVEAAADLTALGRQADVVVTDLPLARLRQVGLPTTAEEAQAMWPGSVVVSITPFGLYGPDAEYVADEITEWASGGLAYVTRRQVPDDDVEHYSPVLPPGRQPEMLAGIAAASGAFAGALSAGSRREAVIVDVSMQEVQAAMLHGSVPPLIWNGTLSGAPSSRVKIGWLLPAADGEIYIRTVEAHHWDRMIEWMGNPEWAQQEILQDRMARHQYADLITAYLSEWTSQHPRQWMYVDGQAHGVPIALPRSLDEVLEAPAFRERGYWQDLPVGEQTVQAPTIPMLDAGDVPLTVVEAPTDVLARWSQSS